MLLAYFGPETMMPVVSLIAAVFGLVVFIWPAWRICSRRVSRALGLLIMVPLVDLGLLYFLAFSEWPALRNQKSSTNLEL